MSPMAILCFAAFVIAVLFSLGFLIRKDKTAITVSVAVLLAGLAAALGTAAARYGLDPLALSRPPVPFLGPLALVGLMIHRLFMQLARLDTERRRHGFVLFLLLAPAILSDVLVHVLRMQDGVPSPWRLVIPCLHVITALSVIALCAAALIRVFGLYTSETMTGLAWIVLGASGAGIVALLIGLAGMAIGYAGLYAALDGFVASAVMAGALAFFRWPDALGRFREETVRQRYTRSLLAGLDVRGLIDGMTAMVRSKGLYRDENCTLDELAKRMGLTRHQASEMLNDRMGTNYSTFINRFRIEEAKELLLSEPDLTVLAVALDVGFGNKTSFNEAFRREVGMSPKEFRKKHAQIHQER